MRDLRLMVKGLVAGAWSLESYDLVASPRLGVVRLRIRVPRIWILPLPWVPSASQWAKQVSTSVAN